MAGVKTKQSVEMVIRQRGKRHLARVERWGTDALECIAAKCHLVSKAKSTEDWDMFLKSIYEAVLTLTNVQRSILLMSQEYGITRREVARILNMDHSIAHVQYRRAIVKVSDYMRDRDLLKPLADVSDSCAPYFWRYNKLGESNGKDSKINTNRINAEDRAIDKLWKATRGQQLQPQVSEDIVEEGAQGRKDIKTRGCLQLRRERTFIYCYQ